jgi:hypothetical protein
MGMSGISKSRVSRLCEEVDGRVKAFLERPYLWIDATYVIVRQNGRIVSVAVIAAVGVNTDRRREVLDIGPALARKQLRSHAADSRHFLAVGEAREDKGSSRGSRKKCYSLCPLR